MFTPQVTQKYTQIQSCHWSPEPSNLCMILTKDDFLQNIIIKSSSKVSSMVATMISKEGQLTQAYTMKRNPKYQTTLPNYLLAMINYSWPYKPMQITFTNNSITLWKTLINLGMKLFVKGIMIHPFRNILNLIEIFPERFQWKAFTTKWFIVVYYSRTITEGKEGF